jgi:hypothetical protein
MPETQTKNLFIDYLISAILSSGSIGFCVGSLLSAASWSQIWPVDAIIYSSPFILQGIMIAYIGWRNAKGLLRVAASSFLGSLIISVLFFSNPIDIPAEIVPWQLFVVVFMGIHMSISLAILYIRLPMWLHKGYIRLKNYLLSE